MKRIMIEYEKCDGCKNCYVACMQAHRAVSYTQLCGYGNYASGRGM